MNGYLLDTNIISEIRRGDNRANPNVWKWWLNMRDENIFLSVLTLGEIRKGIERLAPRDPAQTEVLENWFIKLKTEFSEHLIEISPAIAETWGRLQTIRSLPEIDALLAATALELDVTMVTRNAHDFADLGLRVLNPFDEKP